MSDSDLLPISKSTVVTPRQTTSLMNLLSVIQIKQIDEVIL